MNVRRPRSSPRAAADARDSAAGAPGHERPDGQPGPPSPDAQLGRLDERQLDVLRRLGQEWGRVCGNPAAWREALPMDPTPNEFPDVADVRPSRYGRFVPVRSAAQPADRSGRAAEIAPGTHGL